MADGAARFFKADFDPAMMRLAITRNDGQAIDIEKLER